MSILHLNQIKNHLTTNYSDKIDLSDCDNANAEQLENQLLTRSICAYAIEHHSDADQQVCANSVVDGGDDNGIDGIYFDQNSKTLYIVQSKWIHSGTGEPSNGDIKKFLGGIKDLFNLNFERFNEKINRRKTTIQSALLDPYTTYQIILTYPSINDLAEPSRRDIQDFLSEINDASEKVYFSLFNQRPIHASLVRDVAGAPIDLVIGLKAFGKIDNPYKGFYGQVNGREVLSWWSEHRSRLFKKNIRGVLGDTSVNEEIANTIRSNPHDFWYFNNGITMLCSEATKDMVGGANTDFGNFTCKDISIVNGAQTVSTIGTFEENDAEKLDSLHIPFRVISLEGADEHLGERITKANNRQNRIENSDFVSFDEEQIRLRDELAIEGINYQISRSNSNVRNQSSFDLIEAFTSLACASDDVGVVVQLKREIGKLWEDLNKAPYKQLFNRNTSGQFLYNSVRVQRLIDKVIDEIQTTQTGREQGVMIHGNRILSMMIFKDIGVNNLRNPEWGFNSEISKEHIKSEIQKYFNALYYIFDVEYSGAVIPTFFKNKSKCEKVVELIPDFINYEG